MTMKPTTDGDWTRVGRKHYRHVSGAEVKYDHNRFLWVIVGTRTGWRALWAAQNEVETTADAAKAR